MATESQTTVKTEIAIKTETTITTKIENQTQTGSQITDLITIKTAAAKAEDARRM
jgi:hypothetical protein